MMGWQHWIELVVTVICAVFSSNGVWALIQKSKEKKDARTKMILGLGHDRIIFLCKFYLEQGWISTADLENLYKYLYLPYKDLGGNGVAEKLVKKVEELPINDPDEKE